MLNRSVLIVKAKQPFLNWLRSLSDPADITLEQLNQDNTAYLLPDYTYDTEQEEILADYFDLIFEEQLAGWWKVESDWPADRDLGTFKKWFDVEFHSAILDLVDESLKDEESKRRTQ